MNISIKVPKALVKLSQIVFYLYFLLRKEKLDTQAVMMPLWQTLGLVKDFATDTLLSITTCELEIRTSRYLVKSL